MSKRAAKNAVPHAKKLCRWRQDLIVKAKYQGIVVFVAQRYYPPGKIPDDAMSEGYLGLVEAALRFNKKRGTQFNTYAVFWVRARILQFIVNNYGPVRIGTRRDDRKLFFQLSRSRQRVGNDPQAIANDLDVPVEVVREMMPRMAGGDVSTDQPLSGDDARTVGDTLTMNSAPFEDALEHAAEREVLHAAVEKLNEREQRIVRHRWLSKNGKTLEKLGQEFGLTRERVRQIEAQALTRLKFLFLKAVPERRAKG